MSQLQAAIAWRDAPSTEVPVALRRTFDLEELRGMVMRRIRRLRFDAARHVCDDVRFAETWNVLASLPLLPGQLALFSRRLENAERYLAIGEWGAGCYELMLAESVLKDIV